MGTSRLHRLGLIVLLAPLLSASGAMAQCANQLGLSTLNIAPIAGNPLQAEWVSAWTGNSTILHTPMSPLGQRSVMHVARDSQGRVRIEHAAGTYEVRSGNDPATEVEARAIMICGGPNKQRITLDTLNKTARISPEPHRPEPANGENSPPAFCRFPEALTSSASLRIEELGHRTIEGFDTVGWQLAMLSAPGADGAGKVRSVRELWCSEELGAVLLEVQAPLRGSVRHETSMTKIERREPAGSLFDIPVDYTIEERVLPRGLAPRPGQLRPAPAPANQ